MLPLPAFTPLETLPSWPVVNDPSVLEMLVLTLFIPLGISLVLAALILGPGWRPKS
jgi:hypothetical protein